MHKEPIRLVEINSNKTFRDERGILNKFISSDSTSNEGNKISVVEVIATRNNHKGTIRGLHYEDITRNSHKIVSCISGEIIQYFVDIRIKSETYLETETIVSNENDFVSFKIPPGIAYGYQTLRDNTTVLYGITTAYDPNYYKGINIFDVNFKFYFPVENYIISEKDKSLPFVKNIK
jgi:dTDP-4-dehydrorhamnose 3,5-epimerase